MQLEPQLPVCRDWVSLRSSKNLEGNDGGANVQVEAPEQPQSPFILMDLVGGLKAVWEG